MSNEITKVESSKVEMVIRSAMEFPGVKIDRATFLKNELSKYFSDGVVEEAIMSRPAQAGINVKDIDKIARACIQYETMKVSAISAVAGIPGGFAMAATVPADIAQLFAHIIRILQKLAYLYGWQEIISQEEGMDAGTSNQLFLFMGAMCGVNAANATLSKVAILAAQNVPKQLIRQTLTKGTIYPIIKKTLKIIGIKMTKPLFAKGVGKFIPVIGAIASFGITFAVFKPMANRLKKYLETLPTANR